MSRALGLALFSVAALLVAAPAAQAVPVSFAAFLDGPSENPPNASPGIGFAQVDYDADLHSLRVQATFSDLIGTTTIAHIHLSPAPPANGIPATTVPSFPGFPAGVTSGIYDFTLDLTQLTSFNPDFVTGNGGTAASAEAALFAGLLAGNAYFNIHTSQFPGGEIRGFLQAVPEPGSLALLAAGLGGLLLVARRARPRSRPAG